MKFSSGRGEREGVRVNEGVCVVRKKKNDADADAPHPDLRSRRKDGLVLNEKRGVVAEKRAE